MDKNSNYMSLITSRLSSHYDLTEDFTVGSLTFDLAAKFVLRNERYIFSRQIATLDSCHNNTLCLVKKLVAEPSPMAVTQALSSVTEGLIQLVNPQAEHMSTTVNLVLVTDGAVDSETARAVQGYRFYRSFAWGFRGWCHVGIVLVSLGQNSIYTNKVGRGVLTAFNPAELLQNVK